MYSSYHIVLAVGAFIKDQDGKLLLVKKSSKEAIDAGLWTVPGGKINPTEHIIDGLKREIREEVSLEIIKYTWIGEDVFTRHGYVFHGQHFLCSVKTTTVITLEPNLTEFRWISQLNELDSLSLPKGIKNRITSIPLI